MIQPRQSDPAWWSRRPRIEPGRRIYAVGDLHGRFDLLQTLLKRILGDLFRFPTRRAELVFLGDYLSRGPGSGKVLDFLAERAPLLPLPVVMLRGNHEDMALRFLDEGDLWAGNAWLNNGGEAVFTAYGVPLPPAPRSDDDLRGLAARLTAAMPARHLDLLRGLAISHRSGDYLFVHGGLMPKVPLAEQSKHDMMWLREPFLSDRALHEVFVVHGHTPQTMPEIRPGRINVDTRASESGILTAVVLEGSERRFLGTL